tara:strand:- start:790 stop:1236 length:447 start_codon:yes stop_codon:yes gene_type:complete
MFYSDFKISDTFQNRINLIFLHISFLFNKIKESKKNKNSNNFDQNLFDLIFKKIELNMREIGYGDVTVNKNMKYLVKVFYSILLDSKSYINKTNDDKILFLLTYLTTNSNNKNTDNKELVKYFDKYQTFCFDLCLDSVLKGDLKFTYK